MHDSRIAYRRKLPSISVLVAVIAVMSGGIHGSADGDHVNDDRSKSLTFEFRAVSANPAANGETDFKGKTAVMSTEERIAFLNAYTDYAAAWFGDPKLDRPAVKTGEAERRLSEIKPQPLTSIRKTIRLNDAWKQIGIPAVIEKKKDQPWRTRNGVVLKDGELVLPAGTTEILDLAKSSGWRYELRWEANRTRNDQPVRWSFGPVQAPESSWLNAEGWHSFRLQADLAEKRGYLSKDGQRVAEFPLEHPQGKPVPFHILCDATVSIRNLVFIDYRDRRDKEHP